MKNKITIFHQIDEVIDYKYFLCATRKEKVLPIKPRHATDCNTHPDFRDVKI